ncbi:hypothetical protein D3C86_2097690 [compost metagenome]
MYLHVCEVDQGVAHVHVEVFLQRIVESGCQPPRLVHRVIDRAILVFDGGGVIGDADIPAQLRVDLVLRAEGNMPGVLVLPIGSA